MASPQYQPLPPPLEEPSAAEDESPAPESLSPPPPVAPVAHPKAVPAATSRTQSRDMSRLKRARTSERKLAGRRKEKRAPGHAAEGPPLGTPYGCDWVVAPLGDALGEPLLVELLPPVGAGVGLTACGASAPAAGTVPVTFAFWRGPIV